MRRWYLPLTVLGLGGVGAILLSERGRSVLRGLFEKLERAPERFLELNDDLQSELDSIRSALDQIAASLEPHPEA